MKGYMSASAGDRKRIKRNLTVAFLILLAWLCRLPFPQLSQIPLAGSAVNLLRPLIYIGIFAAWGDMIRKSVINKPLMQNLLAVERCCIVWLLLRTVKYEMTVSDDAVNLFLQYAYYIPFILIPTFMLFASLHTGRGEDYTIPRRISTSVNVVSLALIILVLTNQSHHLFHGAKDGIYTARIYSRGIIYYAVAIWLTALIVSTAVTVMLRSRIPNKRRFAPMPVIVLVIMFVFFATEALFPEMRALLSNDYTAFTCLANIALLQACISSGMLPTNRDYEELFQALDLNLIITDDDLNIRFATAGARRDVFNKEMLFAAQNGAVEIDKNTQLRGYNLRAGYTFWKEDISVLSGLIEELRANKNELSLRNELDRESSMARLKLQKAQENNRLYDLSQNAAKKQNMLLDEILTRCFSETDQKEKRKLLTKASIIGAYIKRRGNLIFAFERNGAISAPELKLCFHESLRNIELTGAECLMDFLISEQRELPSHVAYLIYDTFEAAVENTLDDCNSAYVRLSENSDGLSAFFSIGTGRELPGDLFAAPVSAVASDGSWDILLSLPEGGEAL